jgi:TolA-binding protein
MSELEKHETFERYLKNSLTEAERNTFEAQLRADPVLSEELALERAARSLVAEAGRSELTSRLDAFEAEWQSKRKKTNLISLPVRRLLAAAAVFLALAAAFLWFFGNSSAPKQDLFAAHFEAYRPPSPERGEAAAPSAWQSAAAAYASADYRQAAVFFEKSLQDSSTIAYLARFYLGVSLLAQQPPLAEAALPHFDFVLENDNDYRQQAMWYKALALTSLGQHEAAGVILKEIVERKYFRHTEAGSLLKRLG